MAAAKRRNPIKGPLVTFALMLGSVAAVGAIAHIVDSRQKTEQNITEAQAVAPASSTHQSR
jgi:hypothetical protein